MTDMKRVTISMPDEINKAVYELRKKEQFVKCSYSEIVRILVTEGLKASADGNHQSA